MYSFITQFTDFLVLQKLHLFVIFFFVIWIRWFVVTYAAALYRPYTKRFKATTSVIIPVVNESPELFRQVLNSVIRQNPDEILVVINGPRNAVLKKMCNEITGVNSYWTKKASKRHAINFGLKRAKKEIVVIVDSDTVWESKLLGELVKPFSDPQVGGVTTKQRVLNPTANSISRICDWLEGVRANGSMQAMSVNGLVGCLPGRTIAFRRSILMQVMPDFMSETFLGMHKEVSDDRSLTNLTLKAGYKTVMQNTALVRTEAPTTWSHFIRQQIRWSEGSQYNNLRMTPWMIKNARLMLFIYWIDMIIPFLLWGVYGSWIIRAFYGEGAGASVLALPQSTVLLVALTAVGALVSYAARNLATLMEDWHQVLYVPMYILFLSFVLAPIRIYGFARLADDLGWGTRSDAYEGSS